MVGGIGFLVYTFWNPLKDIDKGLEGLAEGATTVLGGAGEYTEGALAFTNWAASWISNSGDKSGTELGQELIDEGTKSGTEGFGARATLELSDVLLGIGGEESVERVVEKDKRRQLPGQECYLSATDVGYIQQMDFYHPTQIQDIVWSRTQTTPRQSLQEAIIGHNRWLGSEMVYDKGQGPKRYGSPIYFKLFVTDNWLSFGIRYRNDCLFDEFGEGTWPLGISRLIAEGYPKGSAYDPISSTAILNSAGIPESYFPGSQSELDLVDSLGVKITFINGESVFSVK